MTRVDRFEVSLGRVDPLDASVTDALGGLRMQLEAGVGLDRSLRSAGDMCRPPGARGAFGAAADGARRGEDFEHILAALSGILSHPDRTILAAGWEAGRSGWALGRVIERRETLLRARRTIRARMALPVVVLIAAAFIAPLPRFILEGGTYLYLFSALTPLGIAAGAYAAVRAAQRIAARQWQDWQPADAPPPATVIDRIMLAAPILGKAQKHKNRGEFGELLAVLLAAGIGILDALTICARAVPNGIYRREALRCRDRIEGGGTLADALAARPELWPAQWIDGFRVAAEAGREPDMLGRLGADARERYLEAVETWGRWIPRIIYALVSIYVIYQIFRLASRVLQQL